MRHIIFCILFWSLAPPAVAGAWPRDVGTLFIAAGGNFLLSDGAELPVYYDPTIYAEFGVTPRLTLGLDIYTADKGRVAAGFAFASVPLGDLTARTRAAASIGYGYRLNDDTSTEALMRLGLSLGRGLDDGWLALDASATFGTRDTVWRPKVDATWGHNWSDRWTTTFQFQGGQGIYGDYYLKASPTIILTVSDRIKINLGAVKAFTGDEGGALKLETWLTF